MRKGFEFVNSHFNELLIRHWKQACHVTCSHAFSQPWGAMQYHYRLFKKHCIPWKKHDVTKMGNINGCLYVATMGPCGTFHLGIPQEIKISLNNLSKGLNPLWITNPRT